MAYTGWSAGDEITALRLNGMVGTQTAFTPVVTNGGTATFTTKTGTFVAIGPLTWVNVDITINVAGSGSGLVTVTMPTAPDRTQRQVLTMHTESIGAGGNASSHIGGGECVFLAGSLNGTATDRLRTDEGSTTARENNIQGVDLLSGGHITIQGFYL